MSHAATVPSLDAIVGELVALEGARLQRLDVVDERELVLELRVPGRTLRLLASARPGVERVHLVEVRPPRTIPHGPLQAFLRQRLVGQRIARLEARGPLLRIVWEKDVLTLDLRGGRRALVVDPGGAEPPAATPGPDLPAFELNAAAAARAGVVRPEAEAARLRRLLGKGLQAERKKLRRLEKNLLGDLDRLARYKVEGHRGELLKTVLHQVRRGQPQVRAFDWSANEEVEIPLDPRFGPQENLQRFFDRAKKAQRGEPQVEARLEGVWTRLAEIEARLESLEEAEVDALRAELEAGRFTLEGFDRVVGSQRTKRPLDKVARRFDSVDGYEIRVGRSAADNDRLTLHFAKGDDLWLHARGTAGSHVVVRAIPGRTISEEAVLDAAHLAVHHSSAKRESKAEVIVAEVRFVKKTKGAPAGRVGVSTHRTLLVRMEPGRIDRLYGRAPGPAV